MKAGQWLDLRLPGVSNDQGELSIANVLSQSGNHLRLDGTANADTIAVDTNNGLSVAIGSINYRFAAGQISSLEIDTDSGSDQLIVNGSSQAENVTLKTGVASIENSQLTIRAVGAEAVSFNGAGGADVASLYDTNGDDALSLRPLQAEMSGAGFQFNITEVDRIFIHATAGGQDIGYIYDSAGDDRLSVRPQFSSITGPSYYNYISGIERLYAYSTAGGNDVAELYDSAGNDRFSTSGDAASVVGPGFSSYTKFFEQVNVYATSGGNDVAALYGSSKQTQWQRGSDFVSFSEDTWNREARGFERVDAFVAGQSLALPINGLSIESLSLPNATPISAVESLDTSADISSMAAPAMEALTQPWSVAFGLGQYTANYASPDTEISVEPLTNGIEPHAASRMLPNAEVLNLSIEDRLDLPEELLMGAPGLERALLDEIFRSHDEEQFF